MQTPFQVDHIINVHVHGSQYPEILALSFNKAIDIIYQWICLGMYFIVLAYKYISDIYIYIYINHDLGLDVYIVAVEII